jgi:hypothetical protein
LLSSTTPAAGHNDPAAKDPSGRHAAFHSSSEGRQVQPRQQSIPSLPDAVHEWGSPSATLTPATAAGVRAGCCSKAAASIKVRMRMDHQKQLCYSSKLRQTK